MLSSTISELQPQTDLTRSSNLQVDWSMGSSIGEICSGFGVDVSQSVSRVPAAPSASTPEEFQPSHFQYRLLWQMTEGVTCP